MLDLDTVAPLLALTIGWLLNEQTHRMRKSSARTEALNRTLAELLEIRHRLRGMQAMLNEMREAFDLSPAVLAGIRSQLPSAVLIDDNLRARYNGAVSDVAPHAPIVAFELRSKDIVSVLDEFAASHVPEDEEAAAFLFHMWSHLESVFFPYLDRAILMTARKAGLLTWAQTLYYLKYVSSQPEAKELIAAMEGPLEIYFDAVRKHGSAKTPADP